MQKLPILIISSIMILATIQFYAYQPLLPSANTISKDLPATEPITYINIVNSVYQRSMISHAERYIQSGSIVCDRVTQNQMRGLASYNYSEGHVIWGSYPFWKLVYSDFKQKQYDYFLIHIPGKSGGFEEKAETHTSSLIVESTYLSSVLYSNRESFILTKPFMFSALLNKTANP